MTTPEEKAREKIDEQFRQSGWAVQSRDEVNLSARRGVAIRESVLTQGHGEVDYLLLVDGKAVGVLEAEPEGYPLLSVERQAEKYTVGSPYTVETPVRPIPFCYPSTGAEPQSSNGLDPHPRSRRVFQVHRPETLADWLTLG